MTCRETKNLLNAYVDGELDSTSVLTVESHVQRCASCLTDVENLRTLVSAVENRGLRYKAPAYLRQNVQATIRAKNVGATSLLSHWRRASALASVALILTLAWVVAPWRTKTSEQTQVVNDVVSSHVRSLMANHITDVSSSDSHTVKPWFNGKLDYSPPAKDLTAQGFRLVGGRLDYLENRPVAAIVYQRSQHFINLFVWPSNRSAVKEEVQLTIQGYNVIHWAKSDLTYWLISELNQAELNECVRLLKE